MTVAVDAHRVTAGLMHVRENIPVTPGALTLEYPKWIPGEHMPSGPIINLAGLSITAGSTPIAWVRDQVDSYAFHLTVPPGTTSIDVQFDFLAVSTGDYSSARLASANMLALTWNKVVLTPLADDYRTITITPSLILPNADWKYATALETVTHDGASVTFKPVTMEQLIDSPVDAGTNARTWALGSIDGAPVELAAFADTANELDASDATIAKFRALVGQMSALYRARHFNHYTFLLTLSDVLPGEGVEHHQSSDNGVDGDFLTDPDTLMTASDLLPHEFNHSWDGKYRRPADLATPNLHVPMRDDLLWVYEGMTQYYGVVVATRSGLRTPAQFRESLAFDYARLDATTGRTTQPLLDTANFAPTLYAAPRQFASARRSVDFYDEGELMWFTADMTIRRLSGGKKTIDDFARAFFGRTSTGPQVLTYTRDDVIAALEAVQPYDWHGFFVKYVDNITPHPPDPLTPAGWRIVYGPKPTEWEKKGNESRKIFDARYSIGITGNRDGAITDVIAGSPASKAGVSPDGKIVGINNRTFDRLADALDDALTLAQKTGGTLHLLILSGGEYRDVAIPYGGGPKYPALERIPGTSDVLNLVSAPLAR